MDIMKKGSMKKEAKSSFYNLSLGFFPLALNFILRLKLAAANSSEMQCSSNNSEA